jgi:hypothetical protein
MNKMHLDGKRMGVCEKKLCIVHDSDSPRESFSNIIGPLKSQMNRNS